MIPELLDAPRNTYDDIAMRLMYGDGSDGAINHTGFSTFLTRDLYCTTYECDVGVQTKGYRIFATESITIKSGGTLTNNGGSGSNASGTTGGSGGTAASRGSIGLIPLGGASGGSCMSTSGQSGGGPGGVNCDVSQNQGQRGGKGGQGYYADCTTPVGTPGAAPTEASETYWPYRQFNYIMDWFGNENNGPYTGLPGSSGGAGCGALRFGNPVGGGGGGAGAAGGAIFLMAPVIDLQSGSTLQCKGGNGGNGANGAAYRGGGGGAGSAGSGGTVITIYEKLTESGSISISGGSSGSPGTGHSCAGDGASPTIPFSTHGRHMKVDLRQRTFTATT